MGISVRISMCVCIGMGVRNVQQTTNNVQYTIYIIT